MPARHGMRSDAQPDDQGMRFPGGATVSAAARCAALVRPSRPGSIPKDL